jgi:KAP family P-loop domain
VVGAVNERLLRDGCETVALLGGLAGEPSSQAVRLWLERLVYELLQDADDTMAAAATSSDRVSFLVTDDELWIANTGRALTDEIGRSSACMEAGAGGRCHHPITRPRAGGRTALTMPELEQRAAAETAPGEAPWRTSPWGTSPQEAFTAILNNRAKGAKGEGETPVRRQGFIVLVREAQSLQPLQEWCLEQTWNDCLTARFRIDGGPVFGTLLAALVSESKALREVDASLPPQASKSIRFDPSRKWPAALADGVFDPIENTIGSDSGTLDEEGINGILRHLGTETVLAKGQRLVLLAEVVGEPDEDEWERARALFARLPERIGLVLANAPDGFALPDSDPHYLELDLAGVESSEPAEEAYVYEPAALDSDRAATEDRLNLRRYAEAMARLLLHPGTGPMTVAVHGPWGKGKSSFMQFLKASLIDVWVEDAAAKRGLALPEAEDRLRRGAEREVVRVEFNAWRFEDSTQIWAGLASEVTATLERALPWWRRRLTPLAYAWDRHRTELVLELIVPAVLATLILVLAAIGVPELRAWLEAELSSNALAQVLGGVIPGIGSLLAATWILVSGMRRALKPVSDRVLTYVRRPDYREQMGYQHLVLEDIRFVHGRLIAIRPQARVIVFIDDLDRCLSEKVVAILQAINLVLGESEFYVVLGIDTAMIHRAIESHYEANDGGSLPNRFGETYLQKIVQLPFHLPSTSPVERGEFVAHLFSEAARQGLGPTETEPGVAVGEAAEGGPLRLDWNRDALLSPVVQLTRPIVDTPTELRAFLDFQRYLADNPRELKRLVNLHRFVKIVLQQEGRPVAEDIQRKLVKWLVFCALWPDLIDDALRWAEGDPKSRDAIGGAVADGVVDDRGAKEFARQMDQADLLSADDLAPDGPFARAALISQLVVWEPAAGVGSPDRSAVGSSP